VVDLILRLKPARRELTEAGSGAAGDFRPDATAEHYRPCLAVTTKRPSTRAGNDWQWSKK
jgi:hypothetical protein